MKLISTLKSIILESRINLGSFEDENEIFNVNATDHTQIATTPNSLKSRPDFNDLSNVVFEFNDIISDITRSVIKSNEKNSILVRDNWNGFDFIIYPHLDKNKYNLNIATGIKHPLKLNFKKENVLLIITKDGDTVIKEQFQNENFTKIIRGDIIIYII